MSAATAALRNRYGTDIVALDDTTTAKIKRGANQSLLTTKEYNVQTLTGFMVSCKMYINNYINNVPLLCRNEIDSGSVHPLCPFNGLKCRYRLMCDVILNQPRLTANEIS